MAKIERESIKARLSSKVVDILEAVGFQVSGTQIREATAAGHIEFSGVELRGKNARAAISILIDLLEKKSSLDIFAKVLTRGRIDRYAALTEEANKIYDRDGRDAFRAYAATANVERAKILSGEG